MAKQRENSEQFFVEETGLVFEQTGLPRMAGRIFGRLLIAEPPHQSTGQLTESLMASKGSISTMTRLLIQTGLIERISLPGIRHDYFRIRPDAWRHMVRHGLEEEISMFRRLAEHGLELEGKPLPMRERLEEIHNVYSFLEQEFPNLVARWGNSRKRKARAK